MYFQNSSVEPINSCLACGDESLIPVLDLGKQPLANSYKKTQDEEQEEYPLAINHCGKCNHVQLTHAVNPELMFKDYSYVSGTSKTMDEHFKWFAGFTKEYYNAVNNHLPKDVLDIGCNDGSQLNHYANIGFSTYGVDPAENLFSISSRRHQIFVNFFDESFTKNVCQTPFDIITAQNVFAHNYDPLSFMKTARFLMKESSLLFIQTSQADMIVNNEFDTIYHEHISFYNIKSMTMLCDRAGLYLIDVIKTPIHGNSYIFVISRNFMNYRPLHIKNLIHNEEKLGLYSDETYLKYAGKCKQVVNNLVSTLMPYRLHTSKKLVGYGAAAKGMTLLNYSRIPLDYIVDDNPLKQGKFTPGSSIPIVSNEILGREESEIIFVPLAWNFFDEIRGKIKTIRGNRNDNFVRYFPNVEVVI